MPQLNGIRILLSGSVPEEATPEQAEGICSFVEAFTGEVLRRGGCLMHGSHPTLVEPLQTAALRYLAAEGDIRSLILVRLEKFARSPEQLKEIDEQRKWSSVEIIPSANGNLNDSLIPMRDYMASRTDLIVVLGGKWYKDNPQRAGIPLELEASINCGKPGFLLAGYGGAAAGYLKDNPTVLQRLHNGWDEETNKRISQSNDLSSLVESILKQVSLLPLRCTTQCSRMFRILALDGGGIRGAFTAAVLAKWADMLCQDDNSTFANNFDLIAGTSTGAILAIGLGLGFTPKELLSFYKEAGPRIFPEGRHARHFLKSKHNSGTLEEELKKVFGNKILSESQCRLVIPTVLARTGEAAVITTPHHQDRTGYREISAVNAALASAAAPTYFDEAEIDDGISPLDYFDGGIWANNPVLPSIIEAVRHLNIPLDHLDVLSVGTLGYESDFSKAYGKGKFHWAELGTTLFFAAQETGALVLADALLTNARHIRVNQMTPEEIKLDDANSIDHMIARGDKVAVDNFPSVRSRFLDGCQTPTWERF